MPDTVDCPVCNAPFDYLDNILGDYTEIDGTILSGCPMCGEEVEIPQ